MIRAGLSFTRASSGGSDVLLASWRSSVSNIGRIEKLIALTASANEHEARSAAFLACRLIREGGYRVVADVEESWVDPFEAWNAPPAHARRPPPRRPAPDTRPRREVPSEIGRAKWSGRCAQCGETFEEGSDVAFPSRAGDEKLGTVHADCRARWTVLADA